VYEGKTFVGVRLRKFFGLGEGRLVKAAALQGLWRKRFDAAEVKPAVLKPSSGKGGAAEPKVKRSHEHNLEHFRLKRQRARVREQREAEEIERKLEEDRKRVEKRTTFVCEYAPQGCCHRPFLSKHGAATHALSCMYSGEGKCQPNMCWVKLRLRIRWGVGASLQVQQAHSQQAPRVALQLRSRSMSVSSALKVIRPEQPEQPYGLQPHSSFVAHRSEEAQSSAARTVTIKHVHVALQVGRDGHVQLRFQPKRGLAAHRGLPELLPQGWAVRPPKAHTRFTEEQRGFLVKLFDWPDGRLNEQQGYVLFRKQFSTKDGPYSRKLRLSRAQIKAWFSTEKARRLKAGAQAAAGAVDPGAPRAAPAAAPPAPATAPTPAAAPAPAPAPAAAAPAPAAPPVVVAAAAPTAPPAAPPAPAPAPPPPPAVQQRLTVPQMRAAMQQLGHSEKYVNAAKGVAAVRELYVETLARGPAPAENDESDMDEVSCLSCLCLPACTANVTACQCLAG
jgi:hypothetical protein